MARAAPGPPKRPLESSELSEDTGGLGGLGDAGAATPADADTAWFVSWRQADTMEAYDRASCDAIANAPDHDCEEVAIEAHSQCRKLWSFETLSGTGAVRARSPPAAAPLPPRVALFPFYVLLACV